MWTACTVMARPGLTLQRLSKAAQLPLVLGHFPVGWTPPDSCFCPDLPETPQTLMEAGRQVLERSHGPPAHPPECLPDSQNRGGTPTQTPPSLSPKPSSDVGPTLPLGLHI